MGLDQGLLKDPQTALECLPQLQPKKRCRTLPEVSYRDAASNFKMAIVREKYPEDKLVEEDIKDIQSEILQNVDGASTSPQNLLSARRSVDLFLCQPGILQLALHSHQYNQT